MWNEKRRRINKDNKQSNMCMYNIFFFMKREIKVYESFYVSRFVVTLING